MYIEFFGLPGVGKSTICNLLSKDAAKFILRERKKSIKSLNLILVLKSFPSFLFFYIFLAHKLFFIYKNKLSFFKFSKALSLSFYEYFESKTVGQIYLRDHGLIQTLAQSKELRALLIKDHYLRSKIIKKIKKLPCAMFVYLKSDIKTAKDRAALRDGKLNLRSLPIYLTFVTFFDSFSSELTDNSIIFDANNNSEDLKRSFLSKLNKHKCK
ncbi:MAG: hypothetical protein ACTSW3_10185 [Promethearchaeota archaeon]